MKGFLSKAYWQEVPRKGLLFAIIPLLSFSVGPVAAGAPTRTITAVGDARDRNLRIVTIKGQVTDSKGMGIAAVTVSLRNGNISTMTDGNGRFSISVPESSGLLVFSSVGYDTKEVALNGQTVVNVTLSENNKQLQDVVVVGYGTQKKTDLTGSITQVKAADINATVTSNVANALQGRAAGVAVTTANAPGSSPTIRVRGANSITGGNNPLIVVDGFPLENGNLNDINANDIATFDILKDASSTAIYGSRGANGVIMITTKKGSSGKNNVNVSANYGVSSPARLLELVSGQQFVDFINTAYTYIGNKPVYGTGGYVATPPVMNTDWQKELTRNTAATQDYNINFSGGSSKTKYLLSAGMFSQDGLLSASGFERYSLRTNLEQNVTDWFTVGTHLQLNRSVRNANNPSLQDIFRYGFPTMPIRNANGSIYYANEADNGVLSQFHDGTRWNPVGDAGLVTDRTGINRALGDIYAEFKFLNHFTFRSNFGADLSDNKRYYYAPSNSTPGYRQRGVGLTSFSNEEQYITESVLTYANKWQQHRLTATGVISYQDHQVEVATLSGSNFPTDFTGYYNAGLATINNPATSDKYSNSLMSYTGRLAYAFADKYLLTATGRFDGSSRFGANKKWGFFPSMGLGWNMSQENFMKKFAQTISLLKLRGSIGVTGNQDIGNYRSIALQGSDFYTQGGTNTLLGISEGLGNPNLKWERTVQVDAGLDISFWNDLLNVNLDVYNKDTKDLLYVVPVPTTSGFTSITANVGRVRNKGVEIAASVNLIRSSAVKWNIGGNVTWNNNKIVSLYGGVTRVLTGVDNYLVVGDRLNSIYANQSEGIIQTPEQLAQARAEQPKNTLLTLGGEKYKDVNGDGNITSADFVNIGSTDPKFIYGITTSVSFKRFTLDVLGQGASGLAVSLPSNTPYNIMGDYQLLNRIYIPTVYAYERMWSPTNTTGTFARAGARNGLPSDRSNGHIRYFVIRNIKLGYQFKSNWLKKLAIQNLNVFANAQNFVNYSSIRGYNPENGDVAYPYAKTIFFGANLNF